MTQQHPAVPPPELIRQWMERTEYDEDTWFYESYIAEQAAQWGANQELEACCKIALSDPVCGTAHQRRMLVSNIRAARRPKPSLKEMALAALHGADDQGLTHEHVVIIRRALEKLDD